MKTLITALALAMTATAAQAGPKDCNETETYLKIQGFSLSQRSGAGPTFSAYGPLAELGIRGDARPSYSSECATGKCCSFWVFSYDVFAGYGSALLSDNSSVVSGKAISQGDGDTIVWGGELTPGYRFKPTDTLALRPFAGVGFLSQTLNLSGLTAGTPVTARQLWYDLHGKVGADLAWQQKKDSRYHLKLGAYLPFWTSVKTTYGPDAGTIGPGFSPGGFIEADWKGTHWKFGANTSLRSYKAATSGTTSVNDSINAVYGVSVGYAF